VTDDADCSFAFAFAWDESYLYVAARVRDNIRAVPDPLYTYNNDAIEVFLNGTGVPGNLYTNADHQFIVQADGKNAQEFRDEQLQGTGSLPADVVFAVGSSDGVMADWALEMAVSWNELPGGSVAAGRVLAADFGNDDNDNPTTPGLTHYLAWALPTMTCPACMALGSGFTCAPACDPAEFVPLQLGGR
jgi:hypothetical protein